MTDDKQVIGIERDNVDPKTKKETPLNIDSYKRRLSNAIRNSIPESEGSLFNIEIIKYEGKTVCLVRCEKSKRPVFLNFKTGDRINDKDAFYVRNDSEAISYTGSKMYEYIKSNFKN